MMIRKPTAACKKCGRNVPAESLILDNLYGMLVCPDCVKEKKLQSNAAKKKPFMATQITKPVEEPKQEVKERPLGWDSEDDYLERVHKQKEKLKVNFERLDYSRIRYICTKCGFKFVYHIEKRYPSACPNCGTSVITSVIR